MRVAEAVGRALAALGVDTVFGLLGGGNLTVTHALRDAGARFVGAPHEGGAVSMSDGYARVSGRLPACSFDHGQGLATAIGSLAEAAASRTPLLLLAAATPAATPTGQGVDHARLVEAAGAVAERVHSAGTALRDAGRAVRRARTERRAVVLMLPPDVAAAECPDRLPPPAGPDLSPAGPAAGAVRELARLLATAERPAIVAGRGAALAGAGPALRRLGELTGAVLATSAGANGLFAGDPYDIGIAGVLASPLATRLLREADVVVAFGAALDAWTTGDGELIGADAKVVQVDIEAAAIGAHRPVDAGVLGDAAATATALVAALEETDAARPRTAALAEDIRDYRWRNERYEASRAPGMVDPRTLTIVLDDLLPAERTVVVDAGHFMGWPSMYLRVPDAAGFLLSSAVECTGTGLGKAVGAAIARPDRLTVAAIGDGGALRALSMLETLSRLGLPMLVVIYDDGFTGTDFEALAVATGCHAITARRMEDVEPVARWLDRRDRPLVLAAKVDPDVRAGWIDRGA